MSTDTRTPGHPADGAGYTLDVSAVPPVPLARLVEVEARKVVDTRAGFWFGLGVLGLVTLAVVLGGLFFEDTGQTYETLLSVAGGTLGYFLPVLVMLLVTSEWSQRTGLSTFTLEPRRSRIVVAKLIAGFAFSAVGVIYAVVLAAVGVLLSPVNGGGMDWSLGVAPVRSLVLSTVISVLVAFALAMLVRNSPAAIVGYFLYTLVLPGVAAVLGELISGLKSVIPWIEFNTAQGPLFADDMSPTGEQWAQLVVSGTIWLVIPFVLGLTRLLRAEVK
ncbi:ABC transporter permease [Nocardioides sp.]|uniref:ABC transporter permease n=1 Tax=Nocardioides sp. TaxID=35761 RepID=UPI003512C640